MQIKEIKRLEDGRPYVITVANEYCDLEISMKWDGCINLWKCSNGETFPNNSDENTSYMHICEVKDFIKELQSVVDIAEQNFHKDDFKNNWE